MKYRAYDPIRELYTMSDDFNDLAEFFTYCREATNEGVELIIEVFTGAIDIDKIDIYKGDIVDFKDMGAFEVVIEKGNYGIDEFKFRNKAGVYAGWYDPKVIGNIHSNKNMLL